MGKKSVEKGVNMKIWHVCSLVVAFAAFPVLVFGQNRPGKEPVDTWVTVTAAAAGVNKNAETEAVGFALRKAVEEACGTFIRAQTKVADYQTVYDKVISSTAGYVLEHKVLKVTRKDGTTEVQVRARVSTVKFEEAWANAAHTIERAGNPRVLVTVVEATSWKADDPDYKANDGGVVQGKLEDFFNEKGLQLMDKATVDGVKKRDLALAAIKDDAAEQAALGAKFKADVIIVGKATAKFSQKITVGDAEMYQYNGTLSIRAVQCDSGRILMSASYTFTSTETGKNAEDKVLAKLGKDTAPKVLKDVLEAWRKRQNDGRGQNVELMISGMNRAAWKKFEAEVKDLDGVTAVRLRELTESMATIDVECQLTADNLADRLEELQDIRLEIVEQNANRLKAKVVK